MKTEHGTCYYDCLLLVLANPDWTLVHGYPTLTGGPYKGHKYGHAWLEYTEDGIIWCVDHATGNKIPAALYYGVGRIDLRECSRYTGEEALEAARAYGESDDGSLHCGPWTDVPENVLFADSVT